MDFRLDSSNHDDRYSIMYPIVQNNSRYEAKHTTAFATLLRCHPSKPFDTRAFILEVVRCIPNDDCCTCVRFTLSVLDETLECERMVVQQ